MKLQQQLTIAILSLLVHCSMASTRQSVDPLKLLKNEPHSVNSYLEIIEDSQSIWDIHNILDPKSQLLFSKKITTNNRHATYWGKINFTNTSLKVGLYFLYIGKNDFIDAYYIRNDKITNYIKSGYQYPAKEKHLTRGTYYIPIYLGPESEMDVIIKIKEDIHKDPEFDLILYTPKQWAEKILDKQLYDFLFQGIFFVILIYNIFLYITTKQKGYLLYSCYLLGVSTSYLFLSDILRETIIKNTPEYTMYFMPSVIISCIFYWLFALDFLDVRKKFNQYYPYIKTLILADILAVLVSFFYLIYINDIYTPVYICQWGVIINASSAILLVILNYNCKYIIFKYYAAGTGLVVLFSLYVGITWNPNTSDALLIKYGLVLEIIVFSFGLVEKRKLKEIKKKKELDKQIKQLKISENLSQWQKEELEKIIDHRTEKIKRKNKVLKKAFQKAEEAARVKTDFLSMMSHEIRTPMNAVIGTIHLLMSENPQKHQAENLGMLKYSADNLLVLLNDILDHSKIEAGKIKLEHILFDLRQLINGLVNTHEINAKDHGVRFSIHIDDKIPSELFGDPARLTQILNNLINNAIKFSPQGQVHFSIRLLKRVNGKINLKFSIEDTGIGISDDQLEYIFDSFTQAHPDTTRKYGGTGLGLAITKNLISLYDSEINLISKLGKGSTFYFTLSLEENKSNQESHLHLSQEPHDILRNKRVLIVDDNKVNLLMAEKIVKKWGMIYKTVPSGKDAIASIQNHTYDIILLDLQMPEMDGYETARTIRQLKFNTPIIAVSADTYQNVKSRIIAASIDDFIAKPYSPVDLSKMIQNYI